MMVAEVVMAVVSRGGKSWPPKVELPASVEIEDHRLLVLKARRAHVLAISRIQLSN